MKRQRGVFFVGLILLLAGTLSNCTSSPAVLTSEAQATRTPTPRRSPTPTQQVFIPLSTPAAVSTPPLRFNIPLPGPAPISLWRPPLLEAPWALGPFDHFFFSRPVAADEINWPAPDYRYGGIFFSSTIIHTGIDIPAKKFTPVLAAARGKVVWAGYGLYRSNNDPNDPYGLAVTIRHDFGWNGHALFTVYAHLDRIDVLTGQYVNAGDQLGVVGNTGFTTGPHLHFETRIDSNSYLTTLNPELWLVPPQDLGVLAGRITNNRGGNLTNHEVTIINLKTRQKWPMSTYGPSAANGDPYYRENLVLSDLEAGEYEVSLDYKEERRKLNITVYPGRVNYFSFHGDDLFSTNLPPPPDANTILKQVGLPTLTPNP